MDFQSRSGSGLLENVKDTSPNELTLSTKSQSHNFESRCPAEDIETIMCKYSLEKFENFTIEEQENCMVNFEAAKMLSNIESLQSNLALIRLENHILIDFLEKNEPKLLFGLKQQNTSLLKRAQMYQLQSMTQENSLKSSQQPSIKHSLSMLTSGSVERSGINKKLPDYNLNFKTKAEMAEKIISDVEKCIVDIEKNASNEIKQLRAKLEEIRYRNEETMETEKYFKLNFLREESDLLFLNTATEKQVERKLRKFMYAWYRNARALLSTMRLTITSLQESYQQHHNDLIIKSDLSGILTAIDFEKLLIRRMELTSFLEEKNVHMTGLKGVTGKASLAMAEEKQTMQLIEEELKSLYSKTDDLSRAISKLKKDVAYLEHNNKNDRTKLHKLKDELGRYQAPNVNEYIDKKEEAIVLDKEEKMLLRKIYILNMKLNNVLIKLKNKMNN